MEALLAALEATPIATELRLSRYMYPLVNAGHLLGVALLVGAIVPLDLRMLGAWPSVPLEPLARVLRPVAASGLALAFVTGLLLFSVGAREYWATRLFPAKMVLVGLASINALALSRGPLDAVPPRRRRLGALASVLLWVGALVAGRWLGYL